MTAKASMHPLQGLLHVTDTCMTFSVAHAIACCDRWDYISGTLAEARPGEMLCQLPVVHLKPRDAHTAASDSHKQAQHGQGHGATGTSQVMAVYQCPLYKTSARAGVLSTTGHSTNFVVHLDLPIPPCTTPDLWVLQGVAALCAVDT